MAIDHNIIFRSRPINIGETIRGGYSLRDLARKDKMAEQELDEASAIKNAFKNSIVKNADGTSSVDKKRALSEVVNINPIKGMEMQDKMSLQAREAEKAKLEMGLKKLQLGADILRGVDSQEKYEIALRQASAAGLPINDMPPVYDKQYVDFGLSRLLSEKEKKEFEFKQMSHDLAQRAAAQKDTELGLRDREVRAKEIAASKKASAPNLTEGQKSADKDYGKQYTKFTATGRNNAINTIEKLEQLANEVEKDTGFGEAGGTRFSSIMPDFMRSRLAIERRDDARNFANKTLKELFGGQLSDAEREAAAREYWNDSLDNKSNAARIKAKVKELRDNVESQTAQAKYFQKHGTLQGFQFKPIEKEITKTVDGVTYRKVEGGWEAID